MRFSNVGVCFLFGIGLSSAYPQFQQQFQQQVQQQQFQPQQQQQQQIQQQPQLQQQQQFQQQPQQQQFNVEQNNAYLPRGNEAQTSQLDPQVFKSAPHLPIGAPLGLEAFEQSSQNRQSGGSEEILNLNPPLPLSSSSGVASGVASAFTGASEGQGAQVVRAVVASQPQEVQLQQQGGQDSYANYRPIVTQQNGNAGVVSANAAPAQPASTGGNVAAALVSPHEYGETVPGEFSSFDSYAAYQNHQTN